MDALGLACERMPETSLVVMSGLLDRDAQSEAEERGAKAVLMKPFDLDLFDGLFRASLV